MTGPFDDPYEEMRQDWITEDFLRAVSEPRWTPGGPQDVTARRIDLERQEFAARQAVTKEALARGVRIEDAVDRLVATATRTVLAGKALRRREQGRAHVRVPWKTTILIEHPRSWWQRLLRRPVLTEWRDISGTVEGEFPITVDLSHLPTFPHLNAPEGFGPVVFHSTMALPDVEVRHEAPGRRTRPHGYPWASERD